MIESELEKFLKEELNTSMYQRYGFNKNPFYFEINDPFKTIVGRRKEMKMSLEFIREMKEGKIGIVIITGTHGVGKTHLLFAIGELLRAINEGAIKYLDIEEIIEIKGINGFNKINLNGNYEGKLILIDDLDIIYKRYKTEIINFIEKNKGNIVATSDCLFWNSLKTNKDFLMPSAELITIKNLEVYEIIELLNNRIKQTIIDKSNIDGRIINEIGIISDGKPYKAIRVGRRYLKYLIINDSELNFNTFNTFVNEELHLVSKKTIFGIINTLNEKQKTAMDIIINEVEVDANELGEKLNITRNGALQYLKFFEDNNIVESKFKGRRKIYYVPNEIQEDLARSDHEID